ncbi:DUF4886 domain-containing protein [Dysgonomonas sp. 511]|uniref:DUF4886 domain-containing protein n=1 Tax=Dysgonomonas sp. 511 TaxID=2302930 RepID=UPI0013D87DDE|nr:DUF4886 domain-containing protein [Dysgonomonas sp. 511]NDV79180.1 DUF4886 domain-containing protein [Dysgonomonas sp. 511]
MMKNTFFKKNIAAGFLLLFVFFLTSGGLYSCSDDNTKEEPPVVVVEDNWVSLDKSTESILTDDEIILTPSFSSKEVSKRNFVWTSSAPTVASVTKNADNTVTIKGLSPGKTTIKVSCSKDKEVRAYCEVTVTAAPDRTIRILAIGNSFSQDAVEQYLYELAKEEDIPVVVANMYIGGCSLEKHLANANANSAAYEYRKIQNTGKSNRSNVALSEALADENWDYISLQQVSGYSGIYDSYQESLPALVEYVKQHATNPDMKLMLHQTWAYAQNSGHADFPKYDKDQTKMYEAIVDAANRAATLVGIDIVIPSGTAIQNARTSYIGDNFTRDGYHLETTYGRYTAACTWFEKIFGKNVVGNAYSPDGVHKTKIEIAQNAAHAAITQPNAVTILENYKNPPVDTEVMKTPIYIDFGSSMSGTPWNNVTSHSVSATGTVLIDADGDYTKFTVRVSKAFSSVYGGVGTEPTAAVNMGFEVPKAVFADGLMISDANAGEVQISNLDPTLKYNLTVIGLRWNSGVTRSTDYKISGKDSQSYSLAVGIKDDATLIKDKYISANAVAPDASGNISIEVSRSADNPHQAIISAVRISVAQ